MFTLKDARKPQALTYSIQMPKAGMWELLNYIFRYDMAKAAIWA
jgi:hypothetical protein